MEFGKKKDLIKIAWTAFMLSASLPASENASSGPEIQVAILTDGMTAFGSTPAAISCGAWSNSNSAGAQAMEGSSSSYQGTTTGPGPNGGYPGTPHGTYDTNQKSMGN